MQRWNRALLVAALIAIAGRPAAAGPGATAEPADAASLRASIEKMKRAERGPFRRIRWFCKDGTVLPPKPYACTPHGGGVQHGEWTDQVKELRARGYFIANVFADLDVDALLKRPDLREVFDQMLIEQFLMTADNGWIMRQARHYRGALQDEDERKGARRLLLALAAQPWWVDKGYLPLRTGANLLRHGPENRSVATVRQLSAALSDSDPAFKSLRNKIHAKPDAGDATTVRRYAADVKDAAQRAKLERLAAAIEEMFSSLPASNALRALAAKSKQLGALGPVVRDGAARLAGATDDAERLAISGALLAALRDGIAGVSRPGVRLQILDAGIALEAEHFAVATRLRPRIDSASRRQRLDWLRASAEAAYGAGLISRRERKQLSEAFARLGGANVDLETYKKVLDYLALVPGWATQQQRFHFQNAVHRLAAIEPKAELFIQDRLRGSSLLFYAQVLDALLRDANRRAGIRNELFGEDVGAGLRALNPGLARGRLYAGGEQPRSAAADGIYLLPETVSNLPPVAGILTAGEGNPLSHVQLLARNLGIPNVAVDQPLLGKLRARDGTTVILAVSPAGSVRLIEDRGEGEALFSEETGEGQGQVLIRPDLDKLDLSVTEFIPLSRLRAGDSGRTVGPKAAKLGELRHHFPEAVAEGLAIPFGSFRELLEQPYRDSGTSAYKWMVGEYGKLARMPAGSEQRRAATERFRRELHRWIETSDPGPAFRSRLRRALEETFGEDGSYGVFVRSDTNVEDLPGFTGAGLNLTLPNVVGFESVVKAIARVWASPFTARAFSWRQSHMDQPQHVYPAVLLLRSVNADKSGVMVTQDIDTGEAGWLSVAVNEGVGGAVDGQAAESLRIDMVSGEVRLLAQATAPLRRRLKPGGGIEEVPASGDDWVLKPAEIEKLIAFARELPQRFPPIVDAAGNPAPADIEFGFEGGELRLFQLRPFLESAAARSSAYLNALDGGIGDLGKEVIDLDAVVKAEGS